MSAMKVWLNETQQQVMTRLINRTCKRNPNLLDRLATRLLTRVVGTAPHDPELDHPESVAHNSVALGTGSSQKTT